MGNKQTAVGYARVSTPGQVKNISLKDQERQIKGYCKKHNFHLIQVYTEQGSGISDERPEFRKMLGDAASSKFQILIVTDNDRFGRSIQDRVRIRSTLTEDFKIQLHSIADGIFKPDATGRFQDSIKASVSEYYRDLQVEKSASALVYKLEQGERNLGKLLYGLTWSKDKKSAIHHPEEYPILRKVIELRIEKRWSYTKIADYLKQEGITYQGKQWDRNRVSYICSLNPQKYSEGKGSIKFQGKTYEYTFEPLISKSELGQLKNILPDYLVTGTRTQHLLSGKCVCGLCGAVLHHNIIRTKYKDRTRTYKYYTCRNKLESRSKGCKLPSVPQDWIEWWVWHDLCNLFRDQKHFEQILLRANSKLKQDELKLTTIVTQLDEIGGEIQDIDSKTERVVDLVAEGDIVKEVATTKITTLQTQKNKLIQQQQNLKLQQSLLSQEGPIAEQIEKTRLWWLEYSGKIEDKNKRKLVDIIVEEVEVYPYIGNEAEPATIKIVGRIPLFEWTQNDEYYSGILYKNLTFSI